MAITALLSYIAGLLTVLAPCVLPLLPIILGGSMTGERDNRWRPYIITASLLVSLVSFTFLLKASTRLLGIDPSVWSIVSGGLVVGLGVLMLLPSVWTIFNDRLGVEHRSQQLLSSAFRQKNSVASALLTGAALGPVFTSCSPTYIWVISTVLPNNALTGAIYLIIYCLGVATALLGIALLGRALTSRLQWAVNPQGWFQRVIAIVFIIVGLFVATGYDKRIQTYLVEQDWLNLIELERTLVPETL